MNKFISILILTFVFSHSRAFGCDCEIPSSDIEMYWKNSDQIFIGEVVETSSNKLYTKYGLTFTIYTIQIVEPLKGEFHPKFRMRTFQKVGGGSCEYPFKVGKKYLIYADYSGHILEASTCSRTAPLEEVNRSEVVEIKRLTRYYGEDKGPTVFVEKTEVEQKLEKANKKIEELSNTKILLLGTSTILAVLLGFSVFTIIRRKKTQYN
jgi:hypothetical protein